MLKTLNCINCGTYIGEINKGKIHKRAKIYCEHCDKKPVKSNNSEKPFDELFGNLFKKR